MSSNVRKEKRHLWWKQHGKQVDPEDVNENPTDYKKSYQKEVSKASNKEQPTLTTTTTTTTTSTNENNNKKTRFIVFVGNLPFDLKKEDIVHHFRCTGGVTDFRLMTKKDGGKSKGCGFLELDSFVSYEKALNLHHSLVGDRKINVEVTCGGGGSGEKRAEKLNEKKKKFRQKREKKSKTEKTKDDAAVEEKQQDSSMNKNKKKKSSKESEITKDTNNSKMKSETPTNKKRKNTEDDDSSQINKKSLKQSDVMSSIVKDLELETLVKEKQDTNSRAKKKEKKRKRKKELSEEDND